MSQDRAASQSTIERIETVVVDLDDIVEAFKGNRGDESDRRSHVLRVSPPLEGDVRATLHEAKETDGGGTSIDLGPEAFVHVHGEYDPDRTRISTPTREESRSIARKDRGEEVDEETVDDYHAEAMDAWETCVHTSLVDEIRLAPNSDSGSDGRLEVRYEADG